MALIWAPRSTDLYRGAWSLVASCGLSRPCVHAIVPVATPLVCPLAPVATSSVHSSRRWRHFLCTPRAGGVMFCVPPSRRWRRPPWSFGAGGEIFGVSTRAGGDIFCVPHLRWRPFRCTHRAGGDIFCVPHRRWRQFRCASSRRWRNLCVWPLLPRFTSWMLAHGVVCMWCVCIAYEVLDQMEHGLGGAQAGVGRARSRFSRSRARTSYARPKP